MSPNSAQSEQFRTASMLLVCVAVLSFLSACRSETARPAPQQIVAWKPIGSWSGRGDKQTETFTSDNGGFRVRWEAANETAGAGRLRVVFRSGDSGREIIEAIDARGNGSGSEEVAAERPRWYYVTIESANVDWKVSIDERVEGVKASP
jgi:ABC-type glycerol-3-phosphate transport system substrate-binding protein